VNEFKEVRDPKKIRDPKRICEETVRVQFGVCDMVGIYSVYNYNVCVDMVFSGCNAFEDV
jgi:hypothetical protein